MLLFNTTFGVENSLLDEFKAWLRNDFIPTAVADGEYFNGHQLLKVMSVPADGNSTSVALHLHADSQEDIATWYEDHGSRLFDNIMQRWGGRVAFFCTTLEEVE